MDMVQNLTPPPSLKKLKFEKIRKIKIIILKNAKIKLKLIKNCLKNYHKMGEKSS